MFARPQHFYSDDSIAIFNCDVNNFAENCNRSTLIHVRVHGRMTKINKILDTFVLQYVRVNYCRAILSSRSNSFFFDNLLLLLLLLFFDAVFEAH